MSGIVTSAIVYGLLAIIALVSGIGLNMSKLVTTCMVAMVLGVGITALTTEIKGTDNRKELLQNIQEKVEGIVEEEVTVKNTPDKTSLGYEKEGEFEFLGKSDVYTVGVKDKKVQNIIIGDKVVYRVSK